MPRDRAPTGVAGEAEGGLTRLAGNLGGRGRANRATGAIRERQRVVRHGRHDDRCADGVAQTRAGAGVLVNA